MASRKQERQLQQAREAGQIEPEMDTETGATCLWDNAVRLLLSSRMFFIADGALSCLDCTRSVGGLERFLCIALRGD